MQRATGPAGKAGPIQKDARVLVFAGAVLGLSVIFVELEVTLAAQAFRGIASPRRSVVFTASSTRARSSSSDRNAPCEQHPSSGRPATVPWQAGVPNTHVQRDSSQVRSAAIRCSGLSGS